MPDISQLSINLATVRQQWGLIEALEGVARAGIPAVAPWRDQIAAVGLKAGVRRFRDLGLKCSGLCRGGMFPAASPEGRKAAIEDSLRALEEAVAFDAACLVLVVGGLPDGSRDLADARSQVEDGIAALLEPARAAGMPLAIEPLHPMYAADRACVNTMRQALDICDRLGPGVGVACDVYHVWWDPDLQSQIARAGRDRLHAFHICDWLRDTKDLLLDRGMMGDGVIDIPLIRGWVEGQGFTGYHEVEIFSAQNWWKRDPDEVLATCVERHRTAC
ncbi:MAG: sugar phosphate isomerase/epimerase family protein [Paracoccaceae bacterium]